VNQERLLEIERRQNRDRNRIDDLASTVAELRQLLNKLANGLGGGQGGGASTFLHWARIPTGGVDAAAGTWPSLTPSSFTSDVYRSGPALAIAAEAATVLWFYLDPADAGKLVPCIPNADGSFSAILDACTVIPEDA